MNSPIYITFIGSITKKTVNSFIVTCNNAIKEFKSQELHLYLDSGGGAIGQAFSLCNYIKALPLETHVYAGNSVDSCAINVMLASSKRYSTGNSTFFFHHVVTSFDPEKRFSVGELKIEISKLQNDQDKIVEHISESTNTSVELIKSYINIGKIIGTKSALEINLIHEVKQYIIPTIAHVYHISEIENNI